MKNKVYILAVVYAIIIGFSPLFLKQAIAYQSATAVVIHRFLIASILFHIFHRKQTKIKTYFDLLPLSLFFPLLTFIFQALALKTATTLQVGIIQANVPIIASIGAYFVWREKLSLNQIGYIVLSSLGVMFIMLFSLQLDWNIGLIYSFIATLCWGIYSVYVRYFLKKIDAITISKITITNTAILYFIYGIFNQLPLFQFGNSFTYFISIGYLSVFATVISMSLLVYITNQLGVSKASVFNNLATVITLIVGIVILKENLKYYHIIGSIIVIVSIYKLNRR